MEHATKLFQHPDLEEETINYHLIRSKRRRTIAIIIRRGQVIVRAPAFAARQTIDQFVMNKQQWIHQKLSIQPPCHQQSVTPTLQRSQLSILGIETPIHFDYAKTSFVDYDGLQFRVNISRRVKHRQSFCYKLVKDWFINHAQHYFENRVQDWAHQTGLQPTCIEIKTYKARWGSCSHRGKLSFNWKLMMAPAWVIDYVIVHELCHLKEMNHSSHYWNLVAQHYPDYHEAKHWLNQNGWQLELE